MLPGIFGISGLRGIVGEEINPELFCHIAAAFGALLGPGNVAIGQDSRPSSNMLAAAAAAGLASVGRDVQLLGLCPTPTVLHHVRLHKPAGAIVVTASHNPEPWNGMKLAGSSGRFLSPTEFARFKEFVASGSFIRADWKQVGNISEYPQAVTDHINSVVQNPIFAPICQKSSRRRLRVGLDAVNGATCAAAVELVRTWGCEPMPINCDPAAARHGFPRPPEPTKDNVSALARLVRAQKLDLGFAFDPDGDRLSCVDDRGRPLGEEATICLAAKYVLLHNRGPVVVNLSTTRAMDDICSDFKVKLFRTPVGEPAVVERILETEAVLGGEGNGGVILPQINLTRDSLVAAACVLSLMSFTGLPLSRLADELPLYHMLKTKVPLSRDLFNQRRHHLLEAFPDCRTDERDGLWLGHKEFWLHVRPSNTEPLTRIVVEARTEATAQTILSRVHKLLKQDSPHNAHTGGS